MSQRSDQSAFLVCGGFTAFMRLVLSRCTFFAGGVLAVLANSVHAGTLTNINVTPGSLQVGVSTTYDFSYTLATQLNATGFVASINFPDNFTVASASLSNVSSGGATVAITGIDPVTKFVDIRINAGSIAAGTTVSFRLNNVVNPPVAGLGGNYPIATYSDSITAADNGTFAGHNFIPSPFPVVTNPLIDRLGLRADLGPQQIVSNLNSHFADGDGETLNFTVQGNTNPGAVLASLSGANNRTLTLTPVSFGQATITIRASDLASPGGDGVVDDSFNASAISAINGIVITPSSLHVGGASSYSINFTSPVAISTNGFVAEVDFPNSFNIGAAVLGQASAGAATIGLTSIDPVNEVASLRVNAGNVPANTPVSFRLDGVINPAAPGNGGAYLIVQQSNLEIVSTNSASGHNFAVIVNLFANSFE